MRSGTPAMPSVDPKLEPFLTSKFPKIRVQAADGDRATGRASDVRGTSCRCLRPPINYERLLVARIFERWKPEPCYKAMVGRLEVESRRGHPRLALRAIVSMGRRVGAGRVPPLPGIERSVRPGRDRRLDWTDRQQEGLNMLRPMLAHAQSQHRTARHGRHRARSAARGRRTRSWPWRVTAAVPPRVSAQEVLTRMGVKRVAPRWPRAARPGARAGGKLPTSVPPSSGCRTRSSR